MKTLVLLIQMMAIFSACQSNPNQDTMTVIKDENIVQAVKNKDLNTVQAAIENGSNINAVDSQKRSLLLIATNNADIEMAKYLVQQGADVNQQADNLDSPFLYAGASGQTELVKLFLTHGARFDLFNRYNGTALIPACERGHVETVRLLANTNNYPINHVNRLGWTGLMEAIVLGNGSKKYQQIVQILKDAGAKMDIPDNNGLTPLQHAQNRGFKEIVDIIKS